MRGKPVPLDKRAEATAEYLAKVQWGKKTYTEEERNLQEVVKAQLGILTKQHNTEERPAADTQYHKEDLKLSIKKS